MDTQIANLIKDTKEKKVPEKNPKVKDPKDAQAKELQKYIKRLREKASKARSLALELTGLKVPHQEAMFLSVSHMLIDYQR
ncbi:unnamed protein product [Durusdinium trenchii]|uniref:Uncharacterized protein n=1 Tax=Durusdinium trenchii TaxID=1381693 RepID=A0ABP0PJ82_9DINO